MSKPWQPYALHILDAIAKIQRIQARGDLTHDIENYLQPLEDCIQVMLTQESGGGDD